MLDDSDGDGALFASLFSEGWPAIVLAIIAIIIYLVVIGNRHECAQKKCLDGKPAVLLDHRCLCTEEPQ